MFSPPRARLEVSRLAFGRNPQAAPETGPDLDRTFRHRGWWLAVGDSGGNVTIWEVSTGALHTRILSQGPSVGAIAFSPDGTIMAVGGNNHATLWDIATGTKRLNIQRLQFCLGLSFSPDGTRLAMSSALPTMSHTASDLSRVEIWNIENGRGVQTLRGLSSLVTKIEYSPDSRLVAGLAGDWQVGIWDRRTGALLHLLAPPEGIAPDNAGLAFSRDGRRFGFAAGKNATLWDLDSGGRAGRWHFPSGLSDRLVFLDSGELLLLRVETKSGEQAPGRDADYHQHPRVARLRALLDAGEMRTMLEIPHFNRHVFGCDITHDGLYLAFDGMRIDDRGIDHSIVVFDRVTGKPTWTIPCGPEPDGGGVQFDASGRFLLLNRAGDGGYRLLAMPLGTPARELEPTTADRARCPRTGYPVSRVMDRGRV